MAEFILPGWPAGLREDLAAAYVGIAPSTLRALVAEAKAPAPVRPTSRTPIWRRADLDAWLATLGQSEASSAVNPWD